MELEAHDPPEARGLARDGVRLMVSRGQEDPVHARFRDLHAFLAPGDLLVINTSRTLAAEVDGRLTAGEDVVVHFSTELPDGRWVVELRRQTGGPLDLDAVGDVVTLPGGARVLLRRRHAASRRLWEAEVVVPPGRLPAYLARYGRPIRYPYVPRQWPISAYQTVYGLEPGSAEMPSAGRPFTAEIVTGLVARGIAVTPVVLHAGVSSLEAHEAPYAEYFRVPPETALRVNATRSSGGRVVAVGTTVVRALESVADAGGEARPGEGWTELVITPERGVRVVDALLTGWHQPASSHLMILEAVAGADVLEKAYRAGLERGYLWHEFGDTHLILRER